MSEPDFIEVNGVTYRPDTRGYLLAQEICRQMARAEAAEATVKRVRAVLADAEAGADAWGACPHEWLRIGKLRAALEVRDDLLF